MRVLLVNGKLIKCDLNLLDPPQPRMEGIMVHCLAHTRVNYSLSYDASSLLSAKLTTTTTKVPPGKHCIVLLSLVGYSVN